MKTKLTYGIMLLYFFLTGCDNSVKLISDSSSASMPNYSEAQTNALMFKLISPSPVESRLAFNNILVAKDKRFIAVFIALLRGHKEVSSKRINRMLIVSGLEILSGKNFGYTWKTWNDWYQTTNFSAPTEFKKWQEDLKQLENF